MSLLPLVQIVYWVSLSTWFGGALFVALAAPVIFRTIRESNPMLPTVLSVNLEQQHATLLAGSVVGNVLAALTQMELWCAGGVMLGLVGQWAMASFVGLHLLALLLRTALFVAAVGVVIYHWRVLWPKIVRQRDTYIEHADEPDVANPAKDEFDRYHKESVTLLGVVICALLGLILFSAAVMPTQAVPVPSNTLHFDTAH